MSIEKLSATDVAGNVDTDHLVPAGTQRTVLYGHVVLTTDVTDLNRRVLLQIVDDADAVVFDTHSGAVVAASQTDQHHEFLQGIYRETSFVGSALQVPIGKDTILPPGWKLRITIDNGQAGDTYTSKFVVSDGHEGAGVNN